MIQVPELESITYVSKQYEDIRREMADLKKLLGASNNELKSLKEENKALKESLASCAARVKNLEEENLKQQQWVRMHNVEIVGVPEEKDEVPLNVVLKLSQHIGVPILPSDIEFAYRVQPRRAASASRARPIVARLKQRSVKDQLLAAARKKRNLTAGDMGIGGDTNKIFINENLTKENKILLNSCKQKAKEVNFKFLWTKNCRIFV